MNPPSCLPGPDLSNHLQSRVILWGGISSIISIPRITIGRDGSQIHTRPNLTRPLQKLHAQTLSHMPRDVAMHQPGTRVVSEE